MDVDAYLHRIGYVGPREPIAPTLMELQRAHRQAVPYENLDIMLGRPVRLDRASLFDKIVVRRRGGFCHELNALFSGLLEAMGFKVTLLAAERVTLSTGAIVPRFGHQLLLVELDERWVVDVGFGARGGRVPFRLDQRTPQSDGVGEYRVDADGDLYSLTFRSGATWPHLYDFTLIPRRPEDFWERCRAQQADPYWRDRLICTRATADGTLSLNGRRFAWTRGAERRERDLASTAELIEILRDYFGIVLPAEESIDVYLTGDHRERSRAR